VVCPLTFCPVPSLLFLGQFPGMFQPIFTILGVLLFSTLNSIFPYLLSFAAGGIIYIVVNDLIPQAQENKTSRIATFGVIFGFFIMMCLDLYFS